MGGKHGGSKAVNAVQQLSTAAFGEKTGKEPKAVIPGYAFLGAGPESITPLVVMDSGLAPPGGAKRRPFVRPGMTTWESHPLRRNT
jgi:hypothetical protein